MARKSAEGRVLLDVGRDHVAVVTLNRPESLNSLDTEAAEGLQERLEELTARDDIHVVILTGAGRGFCSGADLRWLSMLAHSDSTVQMMREAGAKEVHMRISSPPITHPDFYGIDTPDRAKLLAANRTLEEMRAFMGADSLAFISVDGIYRAMGYEGRDDDNPQFTDHCFTGEYPTRLRDQEGPPQQKQLSFLAEVG